MVDSTDIIKKTSAKEKALDKKIFQTLPNVKNKKVFDGEIFKKRAWPWLLGGILSLFPSIITTCIFFVDGNTEKITFWWFFNNLEIIYICLMLVVIMLYDIVSTKINVFLWPGVFVIILCAGIYGHLKYRVQGMCDPVADMPNLWIFTSFSLLFVVTIGLVNYISLSYKDKED